MSQRHHIGRRNHTPLRKQELSASFAELLGVQQPRCVYSDKDRRKGIARLNRLRQSLLAIRDTGGLTVVDDGNTLITAWKNAQ